MDMTVAPAGLEQAVGVYLIAASLRHVDVANVESAVAGGPFAVEDLAGGELTEAACLEVQADEHIDGGIVLVEVGSLGHGHSGCTSRD